MKLKKNTTVEELCLGLHPSIQVYMLYVRSLKWDETPNYKWINKLLKPRNEVIFDWV